jgi:hypothetical protein
VRARFGVAQTPELIGKVRAAALLRVHEAVRCYRKARALLDG